MRSFPKAAGVLAFLLIGCPSGPQPTPQPQLIAQPQPAPAPAPTPPPRETPAEVRQTIAAASIYFDYDSSEIRSDARSALRQNADKLNAGNIGVVTVEGHCDERGSTEYNLALGERRANAVKRYLVDLGVPGNNLRTVSFGEERPAVQGHDESAWKYNRRADFTK